MGFLDAIFGLFGSGKVNFGKVNPDDVESFWRVDHELDQAERQGPAQLTQALARWELSSMSHWEKVKGELHQRHGHKPEFAMAASRVQYELQMKTVANSYQMPPEYATPPHGITLDRYAAIKARLDLGHPVGTVLAEFHLDLARWQEVDGTWSWRMSPQADAFASQILTTTYSGMRQQALATYGRS